MNVRTNVALASNRPNRLLAIGAYLVMAVPASLWVLFSPSRQVELESPAAWLPMRDALAPLPRGGSALTLPPPLDAPQAALPVASLSVMPAGGPLPAGAATAPFPDGETLAAAPAATTGRLGAFNGFLSGSSGGQSAAAFGGGQGPAAPVLASAGPLFAASSRSVRTMSPLSAKLRRAMGVVGTLSGLKQSLRLGDGRGAGYGYATSAAGTPEFSAAAAPATAGAPGAGQGAGASAGGTPTESSPGTSASPLSEVPPAGPPTDALPEGEPKAPEVKKAAACDALKKAESDSSALAARLKAAASQAAEELRRAATRAQADAKRWDGEEKGLIPQLVKIKTMPCTDTWGNDYCDGLRACLDAGIANLSAIRQVFARDSAAIAAAVGGLTGAPPASAQGYASAATAIGIESVTLRADIRQHLALVQKWTGQCISAIPPEVCGPIVSSQGCVKVPFNNGNQIKARVRDLAAKDKSTQGKILAGLDKGWCDRYGCASIDVAGLRRDLSKHNDAVHVWKEEAPAEPLAKTADAASHLATAEPLLAAPAGDWTRNLVFGSREARDSHGALSDAARSWRELRDEACFESK